MSLEELVELVESFNENVKVTQGTGASAANRAKSSALDFTNREFKNQSGVTSKRESCFAAPQCSLPVSARKTQHYREGQ